MTQVISAVRSPIGRRNGALSTVTPVDLLGQVLTAAIDRSGVPAEAVEQVVGGCVSQAGDQAPHLVRWAWLAAGLPVGAGATTMDAQCGSGQQAVGVVSALIRAGVIDVGLACGVEMMSRVPLGAAGSGAKAWLPESTMDIPDQFTGAERIARRRGFERSDLDAFGARSHRRALAAWADGRFASEVVPIRVGDTTVDRDEGPRPSTVETLAGLRPVVEGGLHTAGTSSPISDGAAAVLLASDDFVRTHGLTPLATVADQCLVGSDPYYYLDGPPAATRRLLDRNRMTIGDIDRFEVSEAFASVPLSWAAVCEPDLDRVNVNGGAIALGHPVGASGARLVVTAVHELRRSGSETALVAMCCGGAMATGSLLRAA